MKMIMFIVGLMSISNAHATSWFFVHGIYQRCEPLPQNLKNDRDFEADLKRMGHDCRREDNTAYRYVEFKCTNGQRMMRAIIFSDLEYCRNYMRGLQSLQR